MRPFVKMLVWLGLPFLACTREAPSAPEQPLEEECLLQLTLVSEPVSKSILPSGMEDRLDNAFVLLVGENGFSRHRYFDFTSASPSPSVEWKMPAGQDYTIYAVGNMGDIYPSLPRTEQGLDPPDFRYEVPAYSTLKALPMARTISLPSSQLSHGGSLQLPIRLERLMARVDVRINKSGITGGEAAHALRSASVHLRQVARFLYPFRAEGSKVRREEEVFPGNTDYYEFSPAEAWELDSGPITLYVPENRQEPSSGPATYVEYASSKDGKADGVSGSLVYRGYLGSGGPVERNRSYSATLNLSWDGFTWKADGWTIERGEDWKDARRLAFLDADGNPLDYLKIHKKGSGEAFAYFGIDGDGGNGTPGRKDLGSYPYGWYLTGNGRTLSGHDGSEDRYTIAPGVTLQCLGDTLVGRKTVTRLRFAASSAAAVTTEDASDRHLFGLHTMDGALHGTSLQLEIEERPLQFEWMAGGTPSYVAQKGLLRCIDPYTGQEAADAVFHIREGYSSGIRLARNVNGSTAVSLIGPFELLSDALVITDADGDRACPVPLEAKMPRFSCTRESNPAIYVDGSTDFRFTYYNREETVVLRVSGDTSAVYCGHYLDEALVEECIPPVTGCSAGKLGFRQTLAQDGSLLINAFIGTYEGLSPGTEAAFPVDVAKISMKGEDRVESFPLLAYNPWIFLEAPVQGATMNDYTLYHEPAGWSSRSRVGWEPSPMFKPVETGSYSLNVGRIMACSADNIRVDARFNDEGGYLGRKLFTGTPSTSDNWELIYSMAGLREGDIVSHNAGKAQVVLQVINPHNTDSPPLERVVAETYVRLHLYIWPAVADVYPWKGSLYIPSTGETLSGGWVFEAYPYAYTEGKSIHGLENAGYGNFFALPVLKPQDEIYTNQSTADRVSDNVLSGAIARDISVKTGTAVWRLKNRNAFWTSAPEADWRVQLMDALSGVHVHNPPFVFKPNAGTDNLGSLLRAGTFYRQNDVTLYYDPSGSDRVYSTGAGDTDKLFVIHFGGGQELQSSFYFDPANGF